MIGAASGLTVPLRLARVGRSGRSDPGRGFMASFRFASSRSHHAFAREALRFGGVWGFVMSEKTSFWIAMAWRLGVDSWERQGFTPPLSRPLGIEQAARLGAFSQKSSEASWIEQDTHNN